MRWKDCPKAPCPPPCPLLLSAPLIGNSTDPPPPYNASAVRSVVRWRLSGEAPGSQNEETEQDHRLVYSYVYGEGELVASAGKNAACTCGGRWRREVAKGGGQL